MATIDRASQEVYLLALHGQLESLRREYDRINLVGESVRSMAQLQGMIDALELVAFAIEADQPSWIANAFALSGHVHLDPLQRQRRERGAPRNGNVKELYA